MKKINSEKISIVLSKNQIEQIIDCLSLVYSGFKNTSGWLEMEKISFSDFIKANFVEEEIEELYSIVLNLENKIESEEHQNKQKETNFEKSNKRNMTQEGNIVRIDFANKKSEKNILLDNDE
ncbi:MAG: hypothetical protein NZZ41_00990 [Candidatus Dojkabacteria bacterium]|nr:hypothetical protein [Candidatus Dojkabacteria bacterium]